MAKNRKKLMALMFIFVLAFSLSFTLALDSLGSEIYCCSYETLCIANPHDPNSCTCIQGIPPNSCNHDCPDCPW